MSNDTAFTPDWISPPGATIAAILARRQLDSATFAKEISRSSNEVEEIIKGRIALTRELARKLVSVLGATEDFWVKREKNYREGLRQLHCQFVTGNGGEWLSEIPTKEMVKLGWISRCSDAADLLAECLMFFGVPTIARWREAYKQPLENALFKHSRTFVSQVSAVAAWFRQGEIAASRIYCDKWNRQKFGNVLSDIRELTRIPDPDTFLPELTRLCGLCGVAVVVLRAPEGCRASGATRFVLPDRPMILLSARHMTDDHLWFTFFHEAGHLMLHENRDIFVDDLELHADGSPEEDEANRFAQDLIIPPAYHNSFMNLKPYYRDVMRFARELGISRALIAGQLQHFGRIGPDRLNRLKTRYTWSEDGFLKLTPERE